MTVDHKSKSTYVTDGSPVVECATSMEVSVGTGTDERPSFIETATSDALRSQRAAHKQAKKRVNKDCITAKIVAERLVDLCNHHGDPVTHQKLQRLLYYSQAWFLALYEQPLFSEEFEAWIHGPTQPQVYQMLRPFAHKAIEQPESQWQLSKKIEKHLQDVLAAYGKFSSYDLERLSQEEAPWKEARDGLPLDEPSESQISTETMLRFYKARLNDQEEG